MERRAVSLSPLLEENVFPHLAAVEFIKRLLGEMIALQYSFPLPNRPQSFNFL